MFYMYYDDTGNLTSVTNELHENKPMIQIDQDTYVDFVSGKWNLIDYYIHIEEAEAPRFIRKDDSENFNVDTSIHEIEKVKIPSKFDSSSFYIFQDKKKQKWQGKANLSGLQFKKIVYNKYLSQYKKVYVTKEHNPNILIGELIIDMHRFVNKRIFDIETTDNSLVLLDDISLYCPVHHEKFYHSVKGK